MKILDCPSDRKVFAIIWMLIPRGLLIERIGWVTESLLNYKNSGPAAIPKIPEKNRTTQSLCAERSQNRKTGLKKRRYMPWQFSLQKHPVQGNKYLFPSWAPTV